MRHSQPVPVLLTAIILATLFLQDTTAWAEPSETVAELLNRRSLEVSLLHLPIDRVVLGSLQVWDEKTGKLRLRVPGESFDDQQRSVLILHLWATWCGPCKEEFGLWKDLRERMEKQFGYHVKIVHVALKSDVKNMPAFVRQVGDRLPSGPMFFDRDERFAAILRTAFNGRDLPTLPMTLWLGPARTVKQALVGAVSDRIPEVMDSTERLLRTIKFLSESTKQPLPKEEEWDTFTRTGPCRCPCVIN